MAANIVDFPVTLCHESHIATLTLTNFSAQHGLVIQDIRIENVQQPPSSPAASSTPGVSPFRVTMAPIFPLSLAPRHQAYVSVHFHPQQPGQFSADLAFIASSKDFPRFTQAIALKAVAIQGTERSPAALPAAPPHTESEELAVLRRMEQAFRMYQEDTKRQLETLTARLGNLEATLSASSSSSSPSPYSISHLQRGSSSHHQVPTPSLVLCWSLLLFFFHCYFIAFRLQGRVKGDLARIPCSSSSTGGHLGKLTWVTPSRGLGAWFPFLILSPPSPSPARSPRSHRQPRQTYQPYPVTAFTGSPGPRGSWRGLVRASLEMKTSLRTGHPRPRSHSTISFMPQTHIPHPCKSTPMTWPTAPRTSPHQHQPSPSQRVLRVLTPSFP